MSSDSRLNNDEVVTGASFLKTNFLADRVDLEAVFPEFDKAYETDFLAQIEKVKKLDSKVAKTKKQIDASQALYAYADTVNKQLNVLSFKFKSAGIDTAMITAIKQNLRTIDIEGAVDKIETLSQIITDNMAVLAPKGVKTDDISNLAENGAQLLNLNVAQNKEMDEGEKLTDDNLKEYDKLRKMVSKIAGGGKIAFDGEQRKTKYSLTKLISRMRAAKRGGSQQDEENPNS